MIGGVVQAMCKEWAASGLVDEAGFWWPEILDLRVQPWHK